MEDPPGTTWLRSLVWLGIGFVIHVACSRTHSRQRMLDQDPEAAV